jgi:hypothetical protein
MRRPLHRNAPASWVASWVLCAGAAASSAAHGEEPHRRFDGVWDTILSCANSNGALGYSFEFPSTVTNDVLHGEKGKKDEPGWLSIDGTIRRDGSANLYASGLVGAAPFAVGHRPAGTQYGYHIDTHFADRSGRGTRVEGRLCSVTFSLRSQEPV